MINGPEWRKSDYPDCLERTSLGVFGQNITEIINPKLKLKQIREEYLDGSRLIALRIVTPISDSDPSGKEEREQWPLMQKKDDEVCLFDPTQQIAERIELHDRLDYAVSCFGDKPLVLIFSEFSFDSQKSSYLTIRYDENRLIYCCMQAENPYNSSPIAAGERTFESMVPDLINYIRTASADEITGIRESNENYYQDYLDSHACDSDDPPVILTEILAGSATKSLIKKFLPSDVTSGEGLELLNSIGWYATLEQRIIEYCHKNDLELVLDKPLQQIISEKVALDLDQLIFKCLEESLFQFQIPGDVFSRPTWLDHFSLAGFALLDKDNHEPLMQPMNPDGVILMHSYGDTIMAQDHNFKVDLENELVMITCMRRGQQRWSARFPLTIPYGDIITRFSDLDTDFRLIQRLIAASFTKGSS